MTVISFNITNENFDRDVWVFIKNHGFKNPFEPVTRPYSENFPDTFKPLLVCLSNSKYH